MTGPDQPEAPAGEASDEGLPLADRIEEVLPRLIASEYPMPDRGTTVRKLREALTNMDLNRWFPDDWAAVTVDPEWLVQVQERQLAQLCRLLEVAREGEQIQADAQRMADYAEQFRRQWSTTAAVVDSALQLYVAWTGESGFRAMKPLTQIEFGQLRAWRECATQLSEALSGIVPSDPEETTETAREEAR